MCEVEPSPREEWALRMIPQDAWFLHQVALLAAYSCYCPEQ